MRTVMRNFTVGRILCDNGTISANITTTILARGRHVYTTTSMTLDADVVETTRLGEKQGSNRPLRIKLSDEATAKRVLRQAKNLSQSDEEQLRNTYIRKDLTMMERREDYMLRMELKKKRAESTATEDGKRWIIRRGKIVDVTPSRRQSETM